MSEYCFVIFHYDTLANAQIRFAYPNQLKIFGTIFQSDRCEPMFSDGARKQWIFRTHQATLGAEFSKRLREKSVRYNYSAHYCTGRVEMYFDDLRQFLQFADAYCMVCKGSDCRLHDLPELVDA